MDNKGQGVELAYCGLICSDCGAFRHGRCQGCHSPKPMHTRCLVKKCATVEGIECCSMCTEFADLRSCRKLNNFISKVFGLVFRSNRIGNLETIRRVGIRAFLENGTKTKQNG